MKFSFGNRCGHRRDDPRLRLEFEPRRRRPPAIRMLQAKSERFFTHRHQLLERQGIAARSESAEAIVLVVKALLLEWCQVTSRVGWPRSDGYVAGVPIRTLASWAGLNVCRVARAVAALARAGFLEGAQLCETLEDGRIIGYPKVRRIRWSLFYALGIPHRDLTLIAKRARRRGERREEPPAPAASSPAPAAAVRERPAALEGALRELVRANEERLERLGGVFTDPERDQR